MSGGGGDALRISHIGVTTSPVALHVDGAVLAAASPLLSLRLVFGDPFATDPDAEDPAPGDARPDHDARDAVPAGIERGAPFTFTLKRTLPQATAASVDPLELLAGARLRARFAGHAGVREWALVAGVRSPVPADVARRRAVPRVGLALAETDDVGRFRLALASIRALTPEPHVLLVCDGGAAEADAVSLEVSGVRRLVRVGADATSLLESGRRFLLDVLECDVVALLGPGAVPCRAGWLGDWTLAALLHGHAHALDPSPATQPRPGRGLWFDPGRARPYGVRATIAAAALLRAAGPIEPGGGDDPLAAHAARLAAERGADGPVPVLDGDVDRIAPVRRVFGRRFAGPLAAELADTD